MFLVPIAETIRATLGKSYAGIHLVVYGAVLVAVILFARDGLMGVFRNRFDSAVRARRQAAGVTAEERDK